MNNVIARISCLSGYLKHLLPIFYNDIRELEGIFQAIFRIISLFDKEQAKSLCVNSCMALKERNKMNEKLKSIGKAYCEAIQDKEEKIVATMK